MRAVWILLVLLAGSGAWWLASGREPEIGRGLPSAHRAADQEFDRRVRERFPVGTPMAEVERELVRQGFSSTPFREEATSAEGGPGLHFDMQAAGFPCRDRWQVVAHGTEAVEGVRGTFGGICL